MVELGHKRSPQLAADWLDALSLATSAAPAAFFVECGMEVNSVPFAESPAMAKDVHHRIVLAQRSHRELPKVVQIIGVSIGLAGALSVAPPLRRYF